MYRHHWRRIDGVNGSTTRPQPRWGHNCCVIGEDIVLFGGYADAIYMNDVWVFRGTSMIWEYVHIQGYKPPLRSNCSMSYDVNTNQIVVFGGGGPMKARFNTVWVLDWSVKIWSYIKPNSNYPTPWYRTYHTAELKYPYLFVFGGYGVADLDDLWVFNLLTKQWKYVTYQINDIHPCARRFHSSALINNYMFIIAGCYGKYRCIGDVYSMDLTEFLKSGDYGQLKWKEKKLKNNSSFLARWGQSTATFAGKIYIFAGRFSNDLNDLLVFDPGNDTLKAIKTDLSDVPKPRRRHCAGFFGSSMLIFGGFNGEYFNDLHYINVHYLSTKVEPVYAYATKVIKYVNNQHIADRILTSVDSCQVYINYGLIADNFDNVYDMYRFMINIDCKYTKKELLYILECLYRGWGEIYLKDGDRQGLNLAENEPMLQNQQFGNNVLRRKCGSTTGVLIIKDNYFSEFLGQQHSVWYNDGTFLIGNYYLPINRMQLSAGSEYFYNYFMKGYQEQERNQGNYGDQGDYGDQGNQYRNKNKDKNKNKYELKKCFRFGCDNLVIFQIMLVSITSDVIVVPYSFSIRDWMELCYLAIYFCLGRLKSICEMQLSQKVLSANLTEISELHEFSESNMLLDLQNYCFEGEIRNLQPKQISKVFREGRRAEYYNKLKFDLCFLELDEANCGLRRKKMANVLEEKENLYANHLE